MLRSTSRRRFQTPLPSPPHPDEPRPPPHLLHARSRRRYLHGAAASSSTSHTPAGALRRGRLHLRRGHRLFLRFDSSPRPVRVAHLRPNLRLRHEVKGLGQEFDGDEESELASHTERVSKSKVQHCRMFRQTMLGMKCLGEFEPSHETTYFLCDKPVIA